LEELLRIDPEYEVSNNEGLVKLAALFGWKSGIKFLLKRIKNSMNNNFSVREGKLLKKLVRNMDYSDINYEIVLNYFPGKTLPRIIEA